MTQEFVTLPREVVEQAIDALYCTDSEEGSPAYNFELKAIEELRAALEQPQNHIPGVRNMVPTGWKLVPVEPTVEMMDAGGAATRRCYQHLNKGEVMCSYVYRHMLDAAPQPPTTEQSSAVQQPQEDQEPVAWIENVEGAIGYNPYHEAARKLPDGVRFDLYAHPQNLRCKSNQARLATLWGYVKAGQLQVELEPVAAQCRFDDEVEWRHCTVAHHLHVQAHPKEWPLYETRAPYTHPQPKREPLTDEQIAEVLIDETNGRSTGIGFKTLRAFARAIERAHNIK